MDINDVPTSNQYYTYRWHPRLSIFPKENLIVAEAFQEELNFSKNENFLKVESEVKSHLKALSIAKVPTSSCLLGLVPERVYKRFCLEKSKILKEFIDLTEKPKNYNHFLNIQELVTSISDQEVLFDPTLVRSTKQLSIVKSKLNRIIYDPYGTVTGRLTTKKTSLPIMTLAARDRGFMVPTNDILVEFDFNAAEVRTLLSLSGTDQPNIDIHEWNMDIMNVNPRDRKSAKEAFFAWLYNPNRRNKELEKYYDKKIYKSFYDETRGSIETPFGRTLKVNKKKALNYLVQSSSNDMMLEQASLVFSKLKKSTPGSFIKFLMHDSIVLDIKKEHATVVPELLKLFSTTRFGKYLVNVRHGNNFANLRSLRWKM